MALPGIHRAIAAAVVSVLPVGCSASSSEVQVTVAVIDGASSGTATIESGDVDGGLATIDLTATPVVIDLTVSGEFDIEVAAVNLDDVGSVTCEITGASSRAIEAVGEVDATCSVFGSNNSTSSTSSFTNRYLAAPVEAAGVLSVRLPAAWGAPRVANRVEEQSETGAAFDELEFQQLIRATDPDSNDEVRVLLELNPNVDDLERWAGIVAENSRDITYSPPEPVTIGGVDGLLAEDTDLGIRTLFVEVDGSYLAFWTRNAASFGQDRTNEPFTLEQLLEGTAFVG